MKKIKASYFVGVAFICIIAVFFGSVCYRVYRARLFGDYGETPTAEIGLYFSDEDKVDCNWPEKYPFDGEHIFEYESSQSETEVNAQEESEGGESVYLSVVNKIKDSVDYYTSKLLPGRMKYVEANALFNKAVGMSIISGTDSVAVMKNGYLTLEATEKDTDSPSKSLKWFSDILEEKGIDFAYIQYPSKEDKNDNQLPDGMTDYNNINADNLLKKLDAENVKNIDMRELLMQKGGNWYSNFFKTDHHWKPETGVWAAGKIAEILNLDFGYSLDTGIGDINNYNVDVHEKIFLGSQGKIATLTFADPEDISIIYPKQKTNFTVTYNTDSPITGSFDEVIFNKTYLNNDDFYNFSAYSSYLNGNKAVTSIKNNDCKNGVKILVIGGSYNKCVVPYLAQTVERIDLIDGRYFDGSMINYIEKTEPDIVLVACTSLIIGPVTGRTSPFNFE
ncbi:MAG: DHHW family protein [Acutalibacteraceae bacterium]